MKLSARSRSSICSSRLLRSSSLSFSRRRGKKKETGKQTAPFPCTSDFGFQITTTHKPHVKLANIHLCHHQTQITCKSCGLANKAVTGASQMAVGVAVGLLQPNLSRQARLQWSDVSTNKMLFSHLPQQLMQVGQQNWSPLPVSCQIHVAAHTKSQV